MSLGLKKLDAVMMRDPRTDFTGEDNYIIEKSGQDVTYRVVTSTSSSTSNLNFSAPPPSPSTIIDRKILMKAVFKLIFNDNLAVPADGPLLQLGANDAPRAFPLSQLIGTLRITINNISISTELGDYFNALIHYNTCRDAKEYDMSTTPHFLDQYQNYDDYLNPLVAGAGGSAKNALGGYGENNFLCGRGGYPRINIIQNDHDRAEIDLEVSEYLFLNPLLWERFSNQKGFIGVQTFDVVANLKADAINHLWSHNNASGRTFTSIEAVQLVGSPELQFCYITPNLLDLPKIGDDIVYPYYNIDRYTQTLAVLNSGVSRQETSNNIQLKSIPKRIYIFARRSDNTKDLNHTDTFARIDKIQVSWNNRNGIYSGSSTEQLYLQSVKNGLNMSFDQWYKYQGSVFCMDFGSDLGMSSIEACGLLGTYQFQYTIDLTNPNDRENITYTLYTVVVSEGTFTISNNRAVTEIGVISKDDILQVNGEGGPAVDPDVGEGGSWLTGLKKAGKFLKKHHPDFKKIAEGIRKHGPAVADAIGVVAPRVSEGLKTAGKIVDPFAKLVGLGYSDAEARDMMRAMGYVGGDYLNGKGGRYLPKKNLRHKAIGYK